MTAISRDAVDTDFTCILFTVLRILLAAAGILLLTIVFKREVRSKQNHPNAKCLLLLHYAAVMLSAVELAGASIWNLSDHQNIYHLGASETSSKQREILLVCFYINTYGNSVSMAAMFSLGIERALSTVKAHNYEHSSRIVGIFLFIASNLAGVVTDVLLIVNLSGAFLVTTTSVLYCFAAIEVITIMVFALLYVYGVKWQRSKDRIFASLSHKYQPIILMTHHGGRSLPATYIDLMPLYYVLLPVIILWKQRNRRVRTMTDNHQNRNNQLEKENHFRMLHSMFNADLPATVNSIRANR